MGPRPELSVSAGGAGRDPGGPKPANIFIESELDGFFIVA